MQRLKIINYMLIIFSIIISIKLFQYKKENQRLLEQIVNVNKRIDQINVAIHNLEIFADQMDKLVLQSINDEYTKSENINDFSINLSVDNNDKFDKDKLVSNTDKQIQILESSINESVLDNIQVKLQKLEYSTKSLLSIISPISDMLYYLPTITPVQHGYISSRYGIRMSPFINKPVFHRGIDISAKEGEHVYAVSTGTVEFVGKSETLGNFIIIKHPYNFITKYGHLKKIYVKKGQLVKKGYLIAEVGNTGRTTGPHLHYEILANTTHVNPQEYLFDYHLSHQGFLYANEGIFAQNVSEGPQGDVAIGGEEFDFDNNSISLQTPKSIVDKSSEHTQQSVLIGKIEDNKEGTSVFNKEKVPLIFKQQLGIIFVILGIIGLFVAKALYFIGYSKK